MTKAYLIKKSDINAYPSFDITDHHILMKLFAERSTTQTILTLTKTDILNLLENKTITEDLRKSLLKSLSVAKQNGYAEYIVY